MSAFLTKANDLLQTIVVLEALNTPVTSDARVFFV
jgi:hypothetical protein